MISHWVPPAIRRGDPRHDAVTELQNRLVTLGYMTGFADGVFGPVTESAVKAFQFAAAIPSDGIVGPVTAAALDVAQPGPHPVPGGIIPMVADMYHSNSLNLTQLKTTTVIGIVHKAIQGLSIPPDNTYARRRTAAVEMGFLWGAYAFSTADNVATTVAHFLSVAAPDATTSLWLDFEDNAASPMSGAQALEFLDRVAQAVGRPCGIYGGNRIREHVNAQDPGWIDMAKVAPLWQCRYINLQPADTAELFRIIKPIPPWTSNFMIQFAADGVGPRPHQVAGLENGADLNAFNGTADQLRATWVPTGAMA